MGVENKERKYIAIDLKSFYASVECVERGLDPLRTNLVVADASRSEKTICLAVSPSLKEYGIPGRARLFEVIQKVKEANIRRKQNAPNGEFTGKSWNADELELNPSLEIDFIAAPPQMKKYMSYSTNIFNIYMRYIAPEDIHVYSVDEIFADVTNYMSIYKDKTPRMLLEDMIQTVLRETGITATAGIGTNMYLCKIAMDIVAKHIPADENGVRIAELDEMEYRRQLWNHRPLTDFWRVGRGISKKLEENGIYTMGDVARCSIGKPGEFYNEDLLYRLFGVNAELLIDHAWGWEPATIADIKAYKPQSNSLSSGQVLTHPYESDKARLVTKEMTDLLVLDLVEKMIVTDQLVLTIGYDIDNLTDPTRAKAYKGPVTIDHYGRRVPKAGHGTINLDEPTSSTRIIIDAVMELYDRIVDPTLLVRRITIAACRLQTEGAVRRSKSQEFVQLDLFTDFGQLEKDKAEKEEEQAKEKRIQQAVLSIKRKYGKNAILKGMNLEEGATARSRNAQVGGHKA